MLIHFLLSTYIVVIFVERSSQLYVGMSLFVWKCLKTFLWSSRTNIKYCRQFPLLDLSKFTYKTKTSSCSSISENKWWKGGIGGTETLPNILLRELSTTIIKKSVLYNIHHMNSYKVSQNW